MLYLRFCSKCLIILLPLMWLTGCDQFQQQKNQTAAFLIDVFNTSDIKNFNQALRPQKFSFPKDYAAHAGYRNEWWYFTGNVDATTGQHFGYELTIFRVALSATDGKKKDGEKNAPGSSSNKAVATTVASNWRSGHYYIAHLALTDVNNKTFYYSERLSRDAMGLAGAGVYFKEYLDKDTINLKVWLADWGIESVGDEIFPVRLYAKDKDFSLDLVLHKEKPEVLHGKSGFWKKGKTPGDASFYYSIPRMVTVGTIAVGDQKYSVAGDSWFDREWSSAYLGRQQAGWDWFRLQLSDKRELMLHAARDKSNQFNEYSIGSIISSKGASKPLTIDQVEINVVRHWVSPHSGNEYPSAWKIHIPSESLTLQVTPMVADQELNLSARFWEGAVKVSGKNKSDGEIVTGYGHVELAGY